MEIAIAIVSKVGEYLVKPTINQVRYLFCFSNIVQELNVVEKELQSAKDDVEKHVEIAKRNTEEIMETVQDWLTHTRDILGKVQTLKEKVEANKTCFNGWCINCGCRYRLGRNAAKKTKNMLELRNTGKFARVGNRASLLEIEFSAPKDFDLFPSLKPAFDKIIEELKDDNTHMVILYGMGGVGKTTLAKAVGNKVKANGIFDEIVMATVSQTPNFRNIQGRLADLLDLKLEEESDEGRADRLFMRFSNTENKILVILDDVWKEFDFRKEIGIPLNNCKVLLTTRNQHVCTAREGQLLIPLNVLNEDERVALLKKRVGIIDESSEFNDWAIKIAKECGGLPLALATIGNALKGRDIKEWEIVCDTLKKSKLEDIHQVISTEKSVYAILKLSYDYLEDEKIQLCFLLCSLFPEDYEIPLEELVRYGMGLNLFDVDDIIEARMKLCLMIKHLKALGLLIDANGEEFVKMHDLVRDVALWIASKGKNLFMSKHGMSLRDWSNVKGWEQYTAISSMANRIEELPFRLVCPKLEILLLSGIKYCNQFKVSDEYFKEMKEVKVVTLSYVQNLSLKSFQFLTNLKTLELIGCKHFRDISFLGKLNELEILSLESSVFDELPKELGDLNKLRLLDLRGCDKLKRIPASVIPRFSQLEELYMGETFKEYWEAEEASEDGSNARFSELSSLSRLAILSVEIKADWFAEDFPLPELVKYDICVNLYKSYFESYSNTNALRITTIDATSMIVFKALYHTVEYFVLKYVTGCQNIIPTIDQGGLIKLRSLEIEECHDLKCVIDMSKGQVPTNALSSLETIKVIFCDNIRSLVSAMLPSRLHKLKQVTISACKNLQLVFQLEGPFHTEEENLGQLSILTKLKLEYLPKLRCIWKGHTQHVSLRSLTFVKVTRCGSLTYLFTMSLARSLVQLKSLEICGCDSLERLVVIEEGDNNKRDEILSEPLLFSKLESVCILGCKILEYIFPVSIGEGLTQLEELTVANAPQLNHVFYLDHGREENIVAGDRIEIVLPNFKIFTLEKLANFIGFCPENYHSIWPALEGIRIEQCSNLTTSFMAEVLAIVQNVKEKLVVLHIEDCQQLCDGILSQLRYGGLTNLEGLTINNCRAKVIFQLEHKLPLSLPSLKYLSLKLLEELEGLYKGPAHILNLQSLTDLWVSKCQRLKRIFSPTLAQNLLQLKCLDINDCGELEQLIVEDDDEDLTLLNDHRQPSFFPNLSSITILWCHKLKCLFPITIARSLQQLEHLIVRENFQLEEVFGHKDGAEIRHCKEILMPKLTSLLLEELPSLTNFCLVGYHFIFPSLKILEVKDCPKIITRFSFAQNKFVHAQAKAPEMDKEDKGTQFPPEPTVDICCYDFDDFQQTLPPYMEN